MKSIYNFLLTATLTLVLTGCFTSDKPLIELNSSNYYPELEGKYIGEGITSGEPEEQAEEALFLQIIFSKENRTYLCKHNN